MTDCFLVLNTGSSSVKFRLFGWQDSLPLIAGGKVTDIGGQAAFRAKMEGGQETQENLPVDTTHESALALVLAWFEKSMAPGTKLTGVAHRIVHGGERYAAPVRLTPDVMDYLRTLSTLAPLHQPHNLAAVDILAAQRPGLPQYGCFDTTFHAGHEELFYSFALPASLRAQGIRRYGFHGISYDWIAQCLKRDLPHLVPKRVVAAHLGNGASLCAMKDGKSIDTTMGMTALDGLPMGTRCGAIDAGVVTYMIRALGLSAEETERILYEESGLKGLSGLTNDVKALSESDDGRAHFALDYFALRTAQHIATMAVSLGGMEALVFTGGIGENAESVREKILERLTFLPAFETHVIATDEERCMAQHIFERGLP